MQVSAAIEKRRSIRKFTQQPVSKEAMSEMLLAAWLSPTGANLQSLAFTGVLNPTLVKAIFPHTKWAGYVPAAVPTEAEQPTAYIAILCDTTIRKEAETECGAAAMSIMLSAESLGLSTCWLGAIDRPEILSILGISAERYSLHTLVAIGYPAAESFITEAKDGNIKYFYGEDGRFYVPKRPFDALCTIL